MKLLGLGLVVVLVIVALIPIWPFVVAGLLMWAIGDIVVRSRR